MRSTYIGTYTVLQIETYKQDRFRRHDNGPEQTDPSVFTREDTVIKPTLNDRPYEDNLTDIVITPEMVEKKLLKLKISKSAGPDGFHPRILKELSKSIMVPLCKIFNKSIMEGCLPNEWKEAHITP